MKIEKLFLVSVLAVALLGCGKHQPRQFVVLPDVSGSIDRESLVQAFKAIDELAAHLQRGDRLTIIPILGDAEAEASGKILRFEVPANRQAYDADLKDFQRKLKTSLEETRANAAAHPGSKTDILGSVGLARQEFNANAKRRSNILVVLSDFIQEDGETDFRSSEHLHDAAKAKIFSEQITQNDSISFRGTNVYLGLLRSNEYIRLSRDRRAALRVFWMTYFDALGGKPGFVVDGTGLLGSLE